MTGPIVSQTPSQPLHLFGDKPTLKTSHSVATAMDPSTVTLLANAIATGMVQLDAGTGKTYQGDAPMRDPRVAFAEAGQQFIASVAGLQAIMALFAANAGRTQDQEGTAVRSTEAVAATVQTRSPVENPVAPASNPPANGVNPQHNGKEGGSVSLKMSVLVNLLVELRKVLLEARAQDRRESANMITMQAQTTEFAGEAGVRATVDQLSGAIAAGMLMTAVAAASLRENVSATKTRMASMQDNQLKANKLGEHVKGGQGAVRAHVTPDADLRPAHNLGGNAAQVGTGQQAADIRGDVDMDGRPGRAVVDSDASKPRQSSARAAHEMLMESANRAMYRGTLLGAVASPISALGSTSFEIAAAGDRKEQMQLQQAADTQKAMADGREAQARNSEEVNEATRQLVQTLLQMIADTSNTIVNKMS